MFSACSSTTPAPPPKVVTVTQVEHVIPPPALTADCAIPQPASATIVLGDLVPLDLRRLRALVACNAQLARLREYLEAVAAEP
jgi:hypothetical protein